MMPPPIHSEPSNAAPPPPPVSPAPLSSADLEQIERAHQRSKKLRRTGTVAKFNGIFYAVAAGFSGLFWLGGLAFGEMDWLGLIVTLALGVVAYLELKGRKLLLAFDLRGPKWLGWNQLLLLAVIFGYCAYQIGYAYYGPPPLANQLGRDRQIDEMLRPFVEMGVKLTVIFYAMVLGLSVIFVGWNALYYFTRKKLLEAYIAQTPHWVLEIQRRTAH